MTTENQNITIGDVTIPENCRRIFITAELEPSSGDPRIQPTGFPDLGPVLYPDPSCEHGNICIIESEASMANRLEEVCMKSLFTGELKDDLTGIPYIRVTNDGKPGGEIKTASTIDGHRIASEYIIYASGPFGITPPATSNINLHEFIRSKMDMTKTKNGKLENCRLSKQPFISEVIFNLDPLSLLHGYQFSSGFKFVGLRQARALTASIIGKGCERVVVPGVRIDPISDGSSNQAIFQKQRITAKTITAQFSIDVGLLRSLKLSSDTALQGNRVKALIALALWKVKAFLDNCAQEISLRSECKLRLKKHSSKITIGADNEAPFAVGDLGLETLLAKCGFESYTQASSGPAEQSTDSGEAKQPSRAITLKYNTPPKDSKEEDEE